MSISSKYLGFVQLNSVNGQICGQENFERSACHLEWSIAESKTVGAIAFAGRSCRKITRLYPISTTRKQGERCSPCFLVVRVFITKLCHRVPNKKVSSDSPRRWGPALPVVEVTGLEPAASCSQTLKCRFFAYSTRLFGAFVSENDAFVCSCKHCFHVVRSRRWSKVWSTLQSRISIPPLTSRKLQPEVAFLLSPL